MLRPAKVTTPLAAATVVVPDRVPPLGFVAIATVTLPPKPVTVLPRASWTVTRTAGVMALPAVVPLGCTVNTSWLAGAGVTLNAALVAAASPPPASAPSR